MVCSTLLLHLMLSSIQGEVFVNILLLSVSNSQREKTNALAVSLLKVHLRHAGRLETDILVRCRYIPGIKPSHCFQGGTFQEEGRR